MSSHSRPIKGHTDVWLTPLDIIRALGHFDLDPCGYIGHPTANLAYLSSGLEKPWEGRIWLNPPYSEVGKWVQKLAHHDQGGVALVFARTETKWFQDYAPLAKSLFFPRGRITFLRPCGTKGTSNAGAPSVFLAFREDPHYPWPGIKLYPSEVGFRPGSLL